MIDFDGGGELFDAWARIVEDEEPGLLATLLIERSKSGGKHVVYRAREPVEGNQKLAQRSIPATSAEPIIYMGKKFVPRKNGTTFEAIITLIETRGEGGLFLCAPSVGYEIENGSFTSIATITPHQHSILLRAASSLTEVSHAVVAMPKVHAATDAHADRPGDDYGIRGDIIPILEKHGWTLAREGENEHWRRPGKDKGMSATLKDRVFYVFTSNAPPFEASKAYGPFAVYAMLEHGGDYAKAAGELRLAGYGGEGFTGPAVDLSGFTTTAIEVSDADAGEEEDFDAEAVGEKGEAEFPSHLLTPPGIVGEIAKWITATAPMPQPVLSLAAALTWAGTIVGRKIQTPSRLRTNIYCMGVAPTGSGKDFPRKMIKRMAESLGTAGTNYLGGEDIASDSGLLTSVSKRPSVVFSLDEIGFLIASVTDQKAPPHLRNIGRALLTLYSSASEIFLGKEYAGRDRVDIPQPNVSLLGTTQRDALHKSVTPAELSSGLLPRMLVFYCPRQRPTLRATAAAEVPDPIQQWCEQWALYAPENPRQGNIQALLENHAVTIPIHADAETLFEKLHTTHLDAKECPDLWTRAAEHARKLALILAAGSSAPDCSFQITPECAQWACQLVEHCITTFAANIAAHVSDGEYERDLMRVKNLIFKKKNGLKRRDLTRATQSIQMRRRDEVLAQLKEAGQIEVVNVAGGKRGPGSVVVYRAIREG